MIVNVVEMGWYFAHRLETADADVAKAVVLLSMVADKEREIWEE